MTRLALAILIGLASLQAEAAELEYQVKAAFLYNFAKFVEWPSNVATDSETFTIGILGNDAVGAALEQAIQGKMVRQRPIAVKRSRDLESLKDCQVLFIGFSENDRLEQILQALEGRSALTVSELEGAAHRGVMINFVIREQKVRFEVNPKAAERAHLKISSQLLKLASSVTP